LDREEKRVLGLLENYRALENRRINFIQMMDEWSRQSLYLMIALTVATITAYYYSLQTANEALSGIVPLLFLLVPLQDDYPTFSEAQ
jgi:hypothetical protein